MDAPPHSPAGPRVSSALFAPLTLGPITLRNRTVRAAAFEGMSPAGEVSPELIAYHESVAAGGVGLTLVAYTSVTQNGRTFPHQLWLRPEIVPQLRQLTDAVHRHGAAAGIQLGHCGNMSDQAVIGERPLAPSAVFNLFGLALPRAMSEGDIAQLIAAFAQATALAREAGFDAVEIQGGHGYLLSQFLCPVTNRRKDRFGGSLENRARLLLAVVAAAKEAAADRLAVVVKVNVRDGFAGGLELDEAVEVGRLLERAGADGLILSGGFVSRCPMYIMRGDVPLKEMVRSQQDLTRKLGLALFGKLVVKAYPFKEAYFLEEARAFRRALSLPLGLVGGLRSLATMEAVLAEGFELIALARPLIIDPGFVNKLARQERETSSCEPCNRCMATMYYGPARCTEVERLGR